MTGGRPPYLPLPAAVSSPSSVDSRSPPVPSQPSRRRIRTKACRAGGVVDAGQRPGEHLQRQVVLGQMVREGGELCRVPTQALHLEHSEDDPAVRGVRLDLPGGLQCLLELRADPDPGTDLLTEDLVSADAVLGERVQLRVELLAEVRATGIADADVRARQTGVDGRRHRLAGSPGLPRPSVGRGRHPQLLRQLRHLGEAAGVVCARDRPAARAARRSQGRPCTSGTDDVRRDRLRTQFQRRILEGPSWIRIFA